VGTLSAGECPEAVLTRIIYVRIWTEGHDEFISDSYAAIINHLKDEIERLGGIIKLEEEVAAIEVVDGTYSPFTSLLYGIDHILHQTCM